MHLLHTCIKIWKHFLQNCYALFFFSMAKKNDFYLFMRHLHNMVQHTQTTSQTTTNCLSVLDHFVGLALQGLKLSSAVSSALGRNYDPVQVTPNFKDFFNYYKYIFSLVYPFRLILQKLTLCYFLS